MTRGRMGVVVGSVVAVVLALVIGVGLIIHHVTSTEPRDEADHGAEESTTAPEPNDPLAAKGGQGPSLVLTNWDAPIGKGGTVAGVMDPEAQNRAVDAIGNDYRKRHKDAPEKLHGAVTHPRYEAGPGLLAFTVEVKGDKYQVRYKDTDQSEKITGPKGSDVELS